MNEALNGNDAQKWKDAADDEYMSLMKNNTWNLVDLPDGKNLVGCKWPFKLKRNADGSINRYKVRLVAQFTHKKLVRVMMNYLHLWQNTIPLY